MQAARKTRGFPGLPAFVHERKSTMKPTRTWVLIADGARARILENDGTNHGLTAIEGLEFQADHSATHDLVPDREGRSFSSHGHGRSAIDAHSDPHRDLKTKFAHQLADVLARGLEQNSYDRLIIVASPVTLGDLRTAISEQVHALVVGEVAQDLTKIPNGEVANHLKHVLVP
jgi:protein required for attachment to host cells